MDLKKILADKDVVALAAFAKENDLVLREGKLVPRDEAARVRVSARVAER